MNILTKHLLGKYLKYSLIILISLEIFFVGIDFLANIESLPQSANLQLLYLLYYTFYTFFITLPLALILGWIVTLTVLIRNNELVSFYSLGISQRKILAPIILLSTFVTLISIGMQATPLAYAYEEKNKILKNRYFVSEQSNIFLKYNEYFIYFKKLYPLEKKAVGVNIFRTKNNDLVEIIKGEKAYYQNNKWYVIDTKIIKKPEKIDWNNSKLEISNEKFLYTLEGFEPKIINNVYKSNTQFSIIDAIRAIMLLDTQDFNTNKIKANLYAQTIIPFMVLPLIVLIFIYTTPSSRFFNSAKFISLSIFFTLGVWGVMLLVQKLALGDVIIAEIAIILPIFALSSITYYLYLKKVT